MQRGKSKIIIWHNYLKNTEGRWSSSVFTQFCVWFSAQYFTGLLISWSTSLKHLMDSYTQGLSMTTCSPGSCRTNYFSSWHEVQWQEENPVLLLTGHIAMTEYQFCTNQSINHQLINSLLKINSSRTSQQILYRERRLSSSTHTSTSLWHHHRPFQTSPGIIHLPF